MYRPPATIEDDVSVLHDIIRTRSFAVIASVVEGGPQFAYAPVALDVERPRGGVRFHLAKANPLARLDGMQVRLSFVGPDAYISPDWYVSEGMVPTWNYIAVEAMGLARRLDEAGLRRLLVDLSAQEEARLHPKKPWMLDKVPAARLEALLNAIAGFSVPFETLEGKLKLSQDKKPEDFVAVLRALEARDDRASRAVAAAMRRVGRSKM